MSILATAAVALPPIVAAIEALGRLLAGVKDIKARVEAGGELTEADRQLLKQVRQVTAEADFKDAIADALADAGVSTVPPAPEPEPTPEPIPEP